MKVALVHDFLTQLGGAERVLDCLLEIFPGSPVFTLFYDEKSTEFRYKKTDIRVSFLQNFPQLWSYKWYLPLMPRAIESFNFEGFDLVVSDASAFAKGVRVKNQARHLCYCHTPTRYLWMEKESYLNSIPYPNFVKWGARPVLAWLKQWDYQAAQKVSRFVANSREVQSRIAKYYRRESTIIYPPIDTDFFRPANKPSRDYFLAAGRMEPYKKTDLTLGVFAATGLPLKVAGSGSKIKDWKKRYPEKNIEFLGRVSDAKLLELYQNAKAFIFSAKEDAGMMLVEAQACGTPVVAYKAGGAKELVEEGVSGAFFEAQTPEALIAALARFEKMNFNPGKLAISAARYGKPVFKQAFLKTVAEVLPHENRF